MSKARSTNDLNRLEPKTCKRFNNLNMIFKKYTRLLKQDKGRSSNKKNY